MRRASSHFSPALRSVSRPIATMTHRELVKAGAIFSLLLALVWLLLYGTWRAFPFVLPGHSQIYDLKQRIVESGTVFPATADIRVVIFGNSRVLAGFVQIAPCLASGHSF